MNARPRLAAPAGQVISPALLAVALERGVTGSLTILKLADTLGIPAYEPSTPSTRRRAADLLQQILGRPVFSRKIRGDQR